MKNLFRIKVIGAILFCGLMISFKNASADTTKVSLTKQEHTKIISEAKKCKAVKNEFNALFEQWIKNWQTNPITRFSSNTKDSKKLLEFAELVKMGPAIIPLVVEKLMDENNFVGLILYDELQKDEKLKETSPYAGEQQRAIRTCKKWVKSLEN